MSVAAAIRERLLAGETLSQPELAAEYGLHNGHGLREAVRHLTRQGHHFVRDHRNTTPGKHPPIMRTFYTLAPAAPPEPSLMPIKPNRQMVPQSASAAIRAALESGQTLTAAEAAARFNCSPGNVHALVSKMREEGYRFDTSTSSRYRGGRRVQIKAYHLAQFDSAEPAPEETSSNGKGGRPRVPKPPMANIDTMSFPALGAEVTVTLLALSADGDIVLGFRNEESSWQYRIAGTF